MGSYLTAISKLLRTGFIQKQTNWVSYEWKPRDLERRFCMFEMLLDAIKENNFYITCDEKLIHYDNPKRKISYVKPGQPDESTPKYLVGPKGSYLL